MNKKKLVYIILLMISIIITGTLAYFSIVTDRTALVLVLGERDEVFVTLEPFEIKGTLMSTVDYTSFQSNEIEDDYIQITAENFSSVPKKVSFYYRINSIDDALVSTNLKYAITSSNTIDGTYSEVLIGNFSSAVEGHDLTVFEFDIPAETTIFFRVFTYLDGNEDVSSMANSVINAEFRAEMDYTVTPELDTGMIPVLITPDGTYTISDDDELWYDYEKHIWANAVLVTEESRSTYLNTSYELIDPNDILAHLVWIPRYEYRIDNLGTNYAGGTQASPGAISINFIPSYITLPTSSSYKIHPAFTFGEEEISGFWMGKCPTKVSLDNGLANARCWFLGETGDDDGSLLQNMREQFQSALSFNGGTLNNGEVSFVGSDYYGTTNRFDSHMMKNSEWGAVTYLGQSIYGSCEDPTTCYLGMSPLTNLYFDLDADFSQYTEEENLYMSLAIYSGVIDDIAFSVSENEDFSGKMFSERKMSVLQYDSNFIYSGVKAGRNYAFSVSKGYNSGFYGYIGDVYYDTDVYVPLPPAKYYDRYTSTNLETACHGQVCYGHGLSEIAGWYNYSNNDFVSSSFPWISHFVGSLNDSEGKIGKLFFDYVGNDGGGVHTLLAEDSADTVLDDSYPMPMTRTVFVKSSVNGSQNIGNETVTATNGAAMLINKANGVDVRRYTKGDTTEMYTFSQPATDQTVATKDYRYIGANPNNYITFNNETWRIIGVFDGKIKIIKDSSIGALIYDYKRTGVGMSTSEYGSNEWDEAQLMYMLNPTDIAANVALKPGYTHDDTYVYDANGNIIYQKGCEPSSANGTTYNCTPSPWSLNSTALSQVVDVTYYLGVDDFERLLNTVEYYVEERSFRSGSDTLSMNWTGKVALMYPSDYAYTFAYGIDSTCYNTPYFCANGNPSASWLFISTHQWILSAGSPADYDVGMAYINGSIFGDMAHNSVSTRPVVYLRPDIDLSGSGTSEDPYVIG